MKCGACRLEIPAEPGYRCPHCHSVLSYWRLIIRFRKFWFTIAAVVALTVLFVSLKKGWAAFSPARVAKKYAALSVGEIFPEAETRTLLGLDDDRWICGEKHEKGRLLHLRHNRYRAKNVVVFVHGFGGDYLSTWGKIRNVMNDPRYNRVYDFVFYGYATGLNRPVQPFDRQAADLGAVLESLTTKSGYHSVSIVAHSKGGLLTLRTLLDRHADSQKKPFRLHRVVMFAPITENVHLYGPLVQDLAQQLFGKPESELKQIQDSTNSELGGVRADLDKIMTKSDDDESKNEFIRDVLEKIYVVHAREDLIVDAEAGPKKIVNHCLLKLDSEQAPAGPPHYQILEPKEIDVNYEGLKKRLRPIAYPHTHIVKAGEQERYDHSARFEEMLWDRLGLPPRSGIAEREQLARAIHESVAGKVHEMNRFVAEKNPAVGMAWHDIAGAVNEWLGQQFPEEKENIASGKPLAKPLLDARAECIGKLYYIYIFLDMYQRMDDMRKQGVLAESDEMLRQWRTQWIPQLMKSEFGRWMVAKGLHGYYSTHLQRQFEQMAGVVPENPRVESNQIRRFEPTLPVAPSLAHSPR